MNDANTSAHFSSTKSDRCSSACCTAMMTLIQGGVSASGLNTTSWKVARPIREMPVVYLGGAKGMRAQLSSAQSRG